MKTDYHHPIDSLGILKVSMSGIRIEKLEDRINPRVPFPHKHDFFQIILITSGSGLHKIDFEKFVLSKNQIFIMKPGQVHSWQLNKNVTGIVIEFNRESVPEFNENISYSSDEIKVKAQHFERLRSIAEIMRQEFLEEKELYDVCLRGYLSGFLIQLLREDARASKSSHKAENLIDRFRKLVELHYKNEHRVEFYAKELNTTAKALTMQLSRSLGKSPRQLIQERFLMEAKRLLAFTDLSVAEVGYQLGFLDANYFTRFFKSHEKVTPAKFRSARH